MTDPAYIDQKLAIPVTTRDMILRLVQRGFPFETAADVAGVSYATLKRWRDFNPEFDADIRRARGEVIEVSLQNVLTATDWRAHTWYLEKTVEQFKAPKAQTVVNVGVPAELPDASQADVEAALRGDK